MLPAKPDTVEEMTTKLRDLSLMFMLGLNCMAIFALYLFAQHCQLQVVQLDHLSHSLAPTEFLEVKTSIILGYNNNYYNRATGQAGHCGRNDHEAS